MATLQFPDMDDADPEFRRVAQAVLAKRSGAMLNLYRMMLHSPEVTDVWLELATTLRFGLSLAPVLRELVICCVAEVTGSPYEWAHHAPIAAREGATAEQLESLPWQLDSGAFNDTQRTVLEYVRCVATGADPTQALSSALRDKLDPREIIELTALAAFYVATARFLHALDIDIDHDVRDTDGGPPRAAPPG